jgi:hypothetical protein
MSLEIERNWERRLDSLGRAQSRYLWILLVTGLFFWSLKPTAGQLTSTAPLIGIELDTAILEAASSSVLFILVLVAFGALSAYGVAYDEWKKAVGATPGSAPEEDLLAEAADPVPNALDLAVYSVERVHPRIKTLMLFAYPGYLSIFAFEGIRLWCRFRTGPTTLPGYTFFLTTGAVLGVIASAQLLAFWFRRVRRVIREFRQGSQAASPE